MLNKCKWALVTGGSSGIGLETAKLLGTEGINLIIIGLDPREVEESEVKLKKQFPGITIYGIARDLTEFGAVTDIYNYCNENNYEIDILINSAGFGLNDYVDQLDQVRQDKMFELNARVMYQMNMQWLPEMKLRNRGFIVNLSSIAAFQPNPQFAMYGATKAFVYNWTRSLQEELRMQKSKVMAIAVCPTPVRTNFQKNAEMEDSNLFDSWLTVNPDLVAKKIVGAMKRRRKKLVPGEMYNLISKLTSRLPESWQIGLSRLHLSEKKK